MFKKFFRWLNLKLNPFATISAAEAFKDRPLVRSNVPGPYLMSGVTNQYLMMNNSEYREKMWRKESGLATSMDKLEDEILNSIRSIIYDYCNYPYKVIPILNRDSKYRRKVIKLNALINSILEEKDFSEMELEDNSKYNKYIPSGLSLTSRHEKKIETIINILENRNKEVVELFDFEIYQDVYEKLSSLNKSISKIMIQQDYMIEERIDFYNDYLDTRKMEEQITKRKEVKS